MEDRGRAQRHVHGMIKLKGKKCLDLSAYSVTFHGIIKLKGKRILLVGIHLDVPANLVAFHGRIKLGGKKIFGIFQVKADHIIKIVFEQMTNTTYNFLNFRILNHIS